jgi:hypothetical protein
MEKEKTNEESNHDPRSGACCLYPVHAGLGTDHYPGSDEPVEDDNQQVDKEDPEEEIVKETGCQVDHGKNSRRAKVSSPTKLRGPSEAGGRACSGLLDRHPPLHFCGWHSQAKQRLAGRILKYKRAPYTRR